MAFADEIEALGGVLTKPPLEPATPQNLAGLGGTLTRPPRERTQPTVEEFESGQPFFARSEFSRGVARGATRMAGTGLDFLRVLGADVKRPADRLAATAEQIPTKAASISDVVSEPSLAPAYVARVVGELAPQAVAAYLSGGTTAALGRAAGLGAGGVRVAAGLGAATTSIPQEVGDIARTTEERTGKMDGTAALIYGVPSGLLDAVAAERILNKVFRVTEKEAQKRTWRQIVREASKEVPLAGLVESGTEATQEVLHIAADRAADETFPLLTQANGLRVLESAVAGAIGGLALGGSSTLAASGLEAQAGRRAENRRLDEQTSKLFAARPIPTVMTPLTRDPVNYFVRTEGAPNAVTPQQEQVSVSPQPESGTVSRTPIEAGVGDQLQRAAPEEVPPAPQTDVRPIGKRKRKAKPTQVSPPSADVGQVVKMNLGNGIQAEIASGKDSVDVAYNDADGATVGRLSAGRLPNGIMAIEEHHLRSEARGFGHGQKVVERLGELYGELWSDENPSAAASAMWERIGAKKQRVTVGEDSQWRYVYKPNKITTTAPESQRTAAEMTPEQIRVELADVEQQIAARPKATTIQELDAQAPINNRANFLREALKIQGAPEVKPAGWSDERWTIFRKQRQAAIDEANRREAEFQRVNTPKEVTPNATQEKGQEKTDELRQQAVAPVPAPEPAKPVEAVGAEFVNRAANEATRATETWGKHSTETVEPLRAEIRKLNQEVQQMAADARRTKPGTKAREKLTQRAFLEKYSVASMDEANALYKAKNAEWADKEKALESAEQTLKELAAVKDKRGKEWSAAVTRMKEGDRPPASNLGEGLRPGEGMSREAVGSAIQKEPGYGVPVAVISREEAFQITGYSEARGWGGFEQGGQAFLVRDNIATPEGARAVLREEVAHALLRSSDGQRLVAEALARARLNLTEAEKNQLREQGYLERQLLDEFIAKSARENRTWWQRVVDSIRGWLSDRLGLRLTNDQAARVLIDQLRKTNGPRGTLAGEPMAGRPEEGDKTPFENPELFPADKGKEFGSAMDLISKMFGDDVAEGVAKDMPEIAAQIGEVGNVLRRKYELEAAGVDRMDAQRISENERMLRKVIESHHILRNKTPRELGEWAFVNRIHAYDFPTFRRALVKTGILPLERIDQLPYFGLFGYPGHPETPGSRIEGNLVNDSGRHEAEAKLLDWLKAHPEELDAFPGVSPQRPPSPSPAEKPPTLADEMEALNPEQDKVQFGSLTFGIAYKPRLEPAQKAAAVARVRQTLKSFGFPGADDLTVDKRAGTIDNNVIFNVTPDGEMHDSEARLLTRHIIDQIEMQGGRGGDTAYVAELTNFVAKNFNRGNFEGVVSKPVLDELAAVAAGERSRVAMNLRAMTGISVDMSDVARNADWHLKWYYQKAFDPQDVVRPTMQRILEVFRGYFSDAEIRNILGEAPDVEAFYAKLMAAAQEERGSRLYQRLQRELKPKKPRTIEELKNAALTEEAAQQTLDAYQAAGGKIPETVGKRKLTARETLSEVTTEQNIAKIQAALERAYFDAERNAALESMRARMGAETDPTARAEVEAALLELESDRDAVPNPDDVAAGMALPNHRAWVKVKAVMGYSPTSLRLIEQLIQTDFKGVRVGQPQIRLPDTRIDLEALARSPDAEVKRAFDAYLEGVREQMSGATPEVQARVVQMVQDRLVEQLEQHRKQITGRVIGREGSAAKLPGKAPKPLDQTVQELFNAGLLRDRRMVTQFVNNVAAKPAFQRLLPTLPDLIKQVLDTPFERRQDLVDNFARELANRFVLTPGEEAQAKELFTKAFQQKFNVATQRALKEAFERMTPREIQESKRGGIGERITQVANAGGFSDGDVFRAEARQRRWEQPNDAQVAEMREWANQEQAMRESSGDEWADRARAAATLDQRAELLRKMTTRWSQWTRPLITNWRDLGNTEKIANTNMAMNEWVSANLLLKLGFGTRQAVDVSTQMLLNTNTRILARRWVEHSNNRSEGRDNDLQHGLADDLIAGYRAQLSVLPDALAAFKQTLKGRGQARQVEQLVTSIQMFDRMLLNASDMRAQGQNGQARLLEVFAIGTRMARQFASAVDVIQGVPAEAQEIAFQIRAFLREKGLTKLQIDQQYDAIMGLISTYRVEALAQARNHLEATGVEVTPGEIQRAAWHVLRERIYWAMERAGMPADDWHAQNKEYRDLIGWNLPETGFRREGIGGLGGAVAKTGNVVRTALAENVPVPYLGGLLSVPFAFSNAVGISINRVLAFTPMGFFPTWFKGSPHFTGMENIRQRQIEAILGTSLQGLVAALVLSGIWKALPAFWPKDEKERAQWVANGWSPGMVIIPWSNGQELHLSTRTGPLAYLRPGIAIAAAFNDATAKLAKRQKVADERAAKLGLTAEKLEMDWDDWMGIAIQTGWSSVLGGRTASGAVASYSDYGKFNLKKAGASIVSAATPGLPALNEFARLAGGNVNPKLASFWDLLVPLPTSGAQRVNMLGDPMRDENDFRRIFTIMSGGSFPFPTTPGANETQAYATIFGSDYRPPSINPGRGYLINGKYRPLNPSELEAYTASRGAEFKKELGSLSNPTDTDVKAAFTRANSRALAGIGAASLPRTRNAARVKVTARSRPAGLLRGGRRTRRLSLRGGSRLRTRRRRRLTLA